MHGDPRKRRHSLDVEREQHRVKTWCGEGLNQEPIVLLGAGVPLPGLELVSTTCVGATGVGGSVGRKARHPAMCRPVPQDKTPAHVPCDSLTSCRVIT